MARKIYKLIDGNLVEVYNSEKTRFHSVIEDSMPATKHPIDGKYYESKSAFRRVTKASGCVEVGNSENLKETSRPQEEMSSAQFERLKSYMRGENSDYVRQVNNYLRNNTDGRKYKY